jgi:hypothetical protein
MRKKFAVLSVLAALVALAVPASSMAVMGPAGANFEIAGDANGPKLSTSLGSCSLGKISGTIPTIAQQESAPIFPISAPTVGACSSGASMSVSGEWRLHPEVAFVSLLGASAESIVMRFSSLPGCKLTGSVLLGAVWVNGTNAPAKKSAYHADGTGLLKWQNDGKTCALAGTSEPVRFEDTQALGNGTFRGPANAVVNNLTTPASQITVN